jgi:hypothetical protein
MTYADDPSITTKPRSFGVDVAVETKNTLDAEVATRSTGIEMVLSRTLRESRAFSLVASDIFFDTAICERSVPTSASVDDGWVPAGTIFLSAESTLLLTVALDDERLIRHASVLGTVV